MSDAHDDEFKGLSLDGLADEWEQDATLRAVVLHKGVLLQWPDPKRVGCVNFQSMAQNYKALEKLIITWCPQVETPKTISIDHAREQARVPEKIHFTRVPF